MLDSNRLKNNIRPTVVVQRYLGQPVKSNSLGLWYKSPFRNERTASFLINDEKGIHDFGTSKHYDIISFTQELLKIDFKTAVNKLCSDFGIIENNSTSKELDRYLIKRREEELEAKKKLNSWFYTTYGEICDKLREEKEIALHVTGEARAITYKKISSLEILSDLFIYANEAEKYELYKIKQEINKNLF